MILIFIIILILILTITNTKKNNLYEVKSSIDNKTYIVNKTNNIENDIERANVLANINEKILILIKSLNTSDKNRIMLESVPLNIQERDNNNNIGYTINKGDIIGLCIDDDENTLFFIVLHELAHIITKKLGHPPEFWENFEKLIKQAIKINIYDYKNYNKKSVNYCNKDITYTPYQK